ncbi:MAG: low molecular weight protein-tyrosine-phosphatase [Mariprofundaceae bacterium]
MRKRIVFVCLGNICRSPLAEVVVQGQAQDLGLSDLFDFSSAGTGDWHIGKGADPRSAATALQYGLDLSQHKAQQITSAKLQQWDWFIAMDQDNYRNLLAMGVNSERLLMMRQFESDHDVVADVPDPYYGGEAGFEDAYQMLKANAVQLLGYLQK